MAVTESEPSEGAVLPTGRWTNQWKELYSEVIQSGLCTGCAGCVVACPHDVIGYDHVEKGYRPYHLEEELGPDNCLHGEKGCTSCTRACPRFRTWEPEADMHLFGRVREPNEMYGITKDLLLCRASDAYVHKIGQDGGFVSALLIWAMDEGYIDCALTSFLEGDGTSWKAIPGLARNKDEILASAGSRYTYSANTLAVKQAIDEGFSKLALVGMSCQSSALPIMWSRKVGKAGKPFLFNIGLLCSKTFDDAIFEELFLAKYGLRKEEMVKMNIKGVFQIWMKDGSYHEIDLKECHQWTREGCKMCPDFAAEHADISTGGIGEDNDWTLVLVRTDLGREILSRMIAAGCIESRPADTDEKAMKLLRTLSIVSRRRWPGFAEHSPIVGVPPPKKKADGSPPAAHCRGVDPGPLRDALTVGAGVLTGVLSGAFGVGGAVISTPFIRGLGASATIAIGTTLPSVIPSSISGSLRYSRERLVAWGVLIWVVPIGVLCAVGGALLTDVIPGNGHVEQLITAGFVAFTAWRTYAVGRGPRILAVDDSRPADDIGRSRRERQQYFGIGALAGGLSGLLGVGGGIVMVPAFNQWMKMTLKQAIATSLVCVGLFAIPGTITHAALGHIDWRFAFFLTLGVIPGARIGSRLTVQSNDLRLRNTVAIFLAVVAVIYGAGEIAALF